MTDRVPGAPGQYKAVVAEAELQKMQAGESFIITMTRDDQPITEGTPYSKAAVLPDELAQNLCPEIADPTPADAFKALAVRRIYTAHGAFVNADGGDLHGGGTATVTIEPSGLARIDFNFKITQTGTKEDFYAWGLNRDMLSERNKNIPEITPISGGVLSVYDTNGVLLCDKIGFGGFMEGVSQFWCPSRVWQYDGSIGKWPETEFQEGMQLMGTCYGTVNS